MSKIICDICGTSYHENAKQCPVCGCVRPGDVQRVTNEIKADERGASGYTYVKGGRFSKSNVKKRNKASKAETKVNQTKAKSNDTKVKANSAKPKVKPVVENFDEQEPRNNKGPAIVAIVLLLAIIGVVVYIAMGFFDNIAGTGNNPSDPTGQANLACSDIILHAGSMDFDKAGQIKQLGKTLEPKGTTDKVTFTSENPKIATVDEKGNITAVAEGETKIIVKCGKIEKSCPIHCVFVKETLPTIAPTVPGGPGSSDTTDPTGATGPQQGEIALNRSEITLVRYGDSWNLYSGEAAKNQVTYSSDNESVAKFVDGKVEAVGHGITTVYASYNGVKVACLVNCSFRMESDNKPISVNRTGKVYNLQESMNVRSGPGSAEYEKIDTLYLGDQVTVTEIKYASDGTQWGHVEKGWVWMHYIKLDSE